MALSPKLRIPGTSPGSSIPKMTIALISDHVGTNPIITSEWPTLISDMEGTNPLTMSEWLTDSSLPFGGNLDLENTRLLPEVFKLHFGQ